MAYLLHQLLQSSVERSPDNVAVAFKRSQLTYRELDELSERLSHLLQQQGVVREDRVGIWLDKSLEAIVAIFAVLKAGAAYVPLDPLAPSQRIAFIVNNCSMKALLTNARKWPELKKACGESPTLASVIFVENELPGEIIELQAETGPAYYTWADVQSAPATPFHAGPLVGSATEDDLAYILYTSGSTGNPKGVMISHRASLTFIDWCCWRFGIGPEDRLSNHAPFHFDLSILDIFCAIKAGSTVVLVPRQLSVFPRSLADFIENEQITIWYSVPSVLVSLVLHASLERHTFSKLRTILFAGEVFPIGYLRDLMQAIPHPDYFNLYGPTETNVCTYYEVPPLEATRTAPLSIGKACENTEVFAVAENDQPAALGEVGELYVRGPGLMKGYWGLLERTDASLVTNPIRKLWRENAYRTGDLVIQEEDGNYQFLGRRDHQIKSRGYRIELGEIESALYSCPDIEEAVVVPLPDDEIGNALVALVVTRAGRELAERALLAHCAKQIPKYMIPGRVVFRSGLPKTSTGKIDRTSLRNELLQNA